MDLNKLDPKDLDPVTRKQLHEIKQDEALKLLADQGKAVIARVKELERVRQTQIRINVDLERKVVDLEAKVNKLGQQPTTKPSWLSRLFGA